MKHMRTLGLLVLLIGFTLPAVGCAVSEKTPENEATPTPMVVVTRMAALCIGPLTMVDGCLRIGDREADTSYLVVWPPDYEVSIGNDIIRALYDDHEVEVRLGQVVRLSGGEVKSIEAFDERTRQGIAAGCPGPYWLVGSISPVEETEQPGTSADLVQFPPLLTRQVTARQVEDQAPNSLFQCPSKPLSPSLSRLSARRGALLLLHNAKTVTCRSGGCSCFPASSS